ncbi:MAG: tetratricopeptide repeat protein, partial [Muribaculaceae bacterium]|nr:tetratricopeptide repeat protein [Muribaculaceae bacterium]
MKKNFRKRFSPMIAAAVLASMTPGTVLYGAVTDDARAALDRGNYKGAISMLEAARKKTPKDAKINLLLGEAYMDAGRNADAVKMLEQAAVGGQYAAYDMMVDIALEELDPETARETIDA